MGFSSPARALRCRLPNINKRIINGLSLRGLLILFTLNSTTTTIEFSIILIWNSPNAVRVISTTHTHISSSSSSDLPLFTKSTKPAHRATMIRKGPTLWRQRANGLSSHNFFEEKSLYSHLRTSYTSRVQTIFAYYLSTFALATPSPPILIRGSSSSYHT